MKIVKAIVSKAEGSQEKISAGLLAYRNTPVSHGFSPAEVMFSRKLRDQLLLNPENEKSREEIWSKVYAKKEEQRSRFKKYFDQRTKELQPPATGT